MYFIGCVFLNILYKLVDFFLVDLEQKPVIPQFESLTILVRNVIKRLSTTAFGRTKVNGVSLAVEHILGTLFFYNTFFCVSSRDKTVR